MDLSDQMRQAVRSARDRDRAKIEEASLRIEDRGVERGIKAWQRRLPSDRGQRPGNQFMKDQRFPVLVEVDGVTNLCGKVHIGREEHDIFNMLFL